MRSQAGRRRARLVAALGAALSVVFLAGCSGSDPAPVAAVAVPGGGESASLYTLTPLPVPPKPPPTGRLRATMRQSSIDASQNQFEVWIDNDTDAVIRPTAISYRSGVLRSDLAATRLRAIPSQSESGFPIVQPSRPACADTRIGGSPALRVTYRSGARTRTVQIPVQDETDVVGRYSSQRCLELAVRRVAALHFANKVPVDAPGGTGADGHLTLVARASGVRGQTLSIDSIGGTPVLSPVGGAWLPAVTLTGDGPDRRIDLPVKPTRCDAHVFAESGGATTFLVNVHLDGAAGQLRIPMHTVGSKNAIDFALGSCGMLTTVDGGTAGG